MNDLLAHQIGVPSQATTHKRRRRKLGGSLCQCGLLPLSAKQGLLLTWLGRPREGSFALPLEALLCYYQKTLQETANATVFFGSYLNFTRLE